MSEQVQAHKLEIAFDDNTYQTLEKLKVQSKAPDVANTIVDAVRLYQWYLDQLAQGGKFGLIKDGKIHTVNMEF